MSQPYCPSCLTVTTAESDTCGACGKVRRTDEGWPVSTTFRYPWLGYLVDQRYRLVQYLGYGGMGDVYRAESLSVGVSLAAKLIDRRIVPASRTNEDLAERLDREVAAMARLYSPHVTRVIDYYLLPEDIFLLLIEYAPGRTLETIVDELGPLPPDLATDIVRQVLEALAELAEFDLVHRDLKPENIMVQTLPSGRVFVRLLDFGIVKVVARARITEGFVGTPHFAAPEQALDSGRVDLRSDLYSLGCIYFYMLTGRVPFPGDSPVGVLNMHLHSPIPDVREHLPEPYDRPDVFDMVRRLLAKDPDDRPKTAAHVLRMPPFNRAVSGLLAAKPARAAAAAGPRVVSRNELLSNPEPVDDGEERVTTLSEWLDAPVLALAVSPDEVTVAAATRDHELVVWPFDDPQAVRRLALARTGVLGWLFFDAEGQRIVSATRTGVLTIYRVDTLEVVQKLKLPPSMYKWIGPSRLHADVVMAVTPGSMFRWRIGGGLLKLMEGEFLREVAFVGPVGRDETVLFERGSGRRLRLKESSADPRRIEVAWMSSHTGLNESDVLDLAPSGQMLLAGREMLMEANHWHERMAPVDAPPASDWVEAALLSDGNPLVVNRKGELFLLPIGREPVFLGDNIAGLAGGNERAQVVVFDGDGRALHFTVGGVELMPALRIAAPPTNRIWGVGPDLDRVATRLEDPENTLLLARMARLGGGAAAPDEEPRRVEIPPIRAFRWAEDTGTAFAISEDRHPMLLDLEVGEGLMVDFLPYVPHLGCTAGGGRLLCVADRTGLLECLNPANGITLWRLKCESPVTALAASARTGAVAIGFLDGTIQLVHTSSGETRTHVPQAHAFAVEHLRFRPDGAELASLGADGTVQVRRVADGEIASSGTFPAGAPALGVLLDASGTPWVVRLEDDRLTAASLAAPDEPQLLAHATN